jgi:hypothetical protein
MMNAKPCAPEELDASERTSSCSTTTTAPRAGENLSTRRAELAVQLITLLTDGPREAGHHAEAGSLEHVLNAANDHLVRMRNLDRDR